MRDQLIGYLLEALEPDEHALVEAQLRQDPVLQRELQVLSRGLAPLGPRSAPFDPPPGLAARACAFVSEHATPVVLPMREPAAARPHWSLADMVVAAGIFLAASLLFLPALSQSRFAARVTQCQDQLRQVGIGLQNYSSIHNGYFPDVRLEGPVGMVAVRLLQHRHLDSPRVLICPASELAESALLHMPSAEALSAVAQDRLHEQLRGGYGYYLGYVADGQHHSPRNLHRGRFALVADAPSSAPPYHSLNHGGCGQNVLFEDMHVSYMTTCKARGCTDNIFVNDEGTVAVGLHANDAVIGPSHARPVLIRIRSAK